MYPVLLPASLLIPVLHFLLLDDMLERHRYPWGLMPSDLLLFRHLGQVARCGPIILFGFFALSWKYQKLNHPVAIARVSALFYVLTVLYACYGCLIIWMYLSLVTNQ
jgi:hypothetical protein